MTTHDFIPPAEQPFAAEMQYPNDSHDTIWENPTTKDVVLDLHVGTTPLYGDPSTRPKLNREQRTGLRQFVIKAGSRRAISSDFDMAIQHTQCADPTCVLPKSKCKDKTHPTIIVGGFGPQLINVGAQVRPRLHPSLDSLHAEKEAANARARRAAEDAEAARDQLRVAKGELEIARKAEEDRAKMLADRESALAERERKLAEAEAAASRKK